MTTYELRRERSSGEVWAVHLRDGIVIGCCGPLAARASDPRFLYELDDVSDLAGWIDGRRDELDIAEPLVRAP
jgi:hypothetical protein